MFYGWWVLFACVIGMLVGPGQFAFGSLGLFIIPLENEFGWSRSQISLATTVFTISLTICMPVVGKLVDRYGSKEVMLPSVIVIGLCLAAIPLVLAQLWHIIFLFFLMGSLGAAANALPFMLTISSWFDKRRGLVIGIAMAGSGLGYAAVPPAIQFINSSFGWRAGYYTLSGIILLIAVPIIFILYRNKPADMGLLADGKAPDPVETVEPQKQEAGLDRYAAMRSSNFWLLVCIFSLIAFCLFGLMIHLVPMLIDRGMSGADAAFAASLMGITILVVRLPIGYFMDHIFAPRIAQACFLASSVGIALLALGATGSMAFLATVLAGFSIGAEIDLLAFLAGRYFGLKNYGEIFGYLFAAMMLGVSLGPPSFGLCFDIMGNYTAVLYLGSAMLLIAIAIAQFLPPYPDFQDN